MHSFLILTLHNIILFLTGLIFPLNIRELAIEMSLDTSYASFLESDVFIVTFIPFYILDIPISSSSFIALTRVESKVFFVFPINDSFTKLWTKYDIIGTIPSDMRSLLIFLIWRVHVWKKVMMILSIFLQRLGYHNLFSFQWLQRQNLIGSTPKGMDLDIMIKCLFFYISYSYMIYMFPLIRNQPLGAY